MRHCSRGFTLMELMIVVTVASILAAIAYPTYTDYVVRGNRTVAKAALVDAASKQEGFFSDRKAYSATLAGLGFPADPYYIAKDGKTSTTNTSDMVYQVSVTTTTAGGIITTYTISAAPVNGQVRDSCASPTGCKKCGTLILGSDGSRTVSSTAANATDCWAR